MNPSEDNQDDATPVVQQPAGTQSAPETPDDKPAISPQPASITATDSIDQSTPSNETTSPKEDVNYSTPRPADPTQQLKPTGEALVQWDASEFVDHQKSSQWFILLGAGTIAICALIYFTSKSLFSVAVIALAAIAFGIVAKQKPRTLHYRLYPTTLQIGDKNYSYNDFKTFSVVQDGGMQSIVLQPFKRFMPPLAIYFPLEEGEKIFDMLAARVPHAEHKDDSIDRFMKQIRF